MASEPRLIVFVALLAIACVALTLALRQVLRSGALEKLGQVRLDIRHAYLCLGVGIGLAAARAFESGLAFLVVAVSFASLGQVLFAVQNRRLKGSPER